MVDEVKGPGRERAPPTGESSALPVVAVGDRARRTVSRDDRGRCGEERIRRYFQREGDGFRVRQEVRDIVLFANQNVLKDLPFSRIDLISCRNLLIYLERELREQVVSTFNDALNPGGLMNRPSPAGDRGGLAAARRLHVYRE
jgi:hypothetical protein